MLKEFLIRKMIGDKLGGLPKEQQDMIIKAVLENPELFKKIGIEVKAKMDAGKDQMAATMEVLQAHQEELKSVLEPSK